MKQRTGQQASSSAGSLLQQIPDIYAGEAGPLTAGLNATPPVVNSASSIGSSLSSAIAYPGQQIQNLEQYIQNQQQQASNAASAAGQQAQGAATAAAVVVALAIGIGVVLLLRKA
jgi:hypothetical protein